MKRLYLSFSVPRRAVVLPLAALAWNQLIYQGSMRLAAPWKHYDLSLPLDAAIPLLPWTITIYFGCYLLWAAHYIWMAWRYDWNAKQFYAADFLSKLCSLVFFLFLPTVMHRPAVTAPGFWNDAIRFLYQVDRPYNLFPSLHCSVSWLCWASARKDAAFPKWYRYLTLIAAAAVCISTLTTRQHVLLDVFGGILISEVCWLITRGLFALHETKDEKK